MVWIGGQIRTASAAVVVHLNFWLLVLLKRTQEVLPDPEKKIWIIDIISGIFVHSWIYFEWVKGWNCAPRLRLVSGVHFWVFYCHFLLDFYSTARYLPIYFFAWFAWEICNAIKKVKMCGNWQVVQKATFRFVPLSMSYVKL